jgi:hypothetical protein
MQSNEDAPYRCSRGSSTSLHTKNTPPPRPPTPAPPQSFSHQAPSRAVGTENIRLGGRAVGIHATSSRLHEFQNRRPAEKMNSSLPFCWWPAMLINRECCITTCPAWTQQRVMYGARSFQFVRPVLPCTPTTHSIGLSLKLEYRLIVHSIRRVIWISRYIAH